MRWGPLGFGPHSPSVALFLRPSPQRLHLRRHFPTGAPSFSHRLHFVSLSPLKLLTVPLASHCSPSLSPRTARGLSHCSRSLALLAVLLSRAAPCPSHCCVSLPSHSSFALSSRWSPSLSPRTVSHCAAIAAISAVAVIAAIAAIAAIGGLRGHRCRECLLGAPSGFRVWRGPLSPAHGCFGAIKNHTEYSASEIEYKDDVAHEKWRRKKLAWLDSLSDSILVTQME